MEFGVFLNGYLPGPASRDTNCEHTMILREMEYVIHADKHNWKYAWFGEHHSLTEYSHLSSPEVMMGYIAARTDRIHLSTGINNLSPRVNHPVRNAERAAFLDHVTGNRFEWGTGRGAGSHEIATFNILDKDSTKSEWDEVIREIPRMWEQRDYTFSGEHFTVPYPHNVLPKPYGIGHPPIWVACGNPGTFAKAGELGIGAIAFNFEPIYALKGRIEAYKQAIVDCTDPVGQFKNDNVMMTNAVVCLSDREKARTIAKTRGRGYLYSLVCLYHDTMPKPEYAPVWPQPPLDPPATDEMLDELIAGGWLLCGTPDEVCEQVDKYQSVGCDQVVFGLPNDGMAHEDVLEMLELFGTKVIPEFDKDPVHSTTHYRKTAKRKYPEVAGSVPDISVEVLPSNALIK
ncbi:MAG TPA: LLM class flavin-dependent oxidoreductase [Acidimicrobiia bacterium]|nr:LLM class flavin-dependent oxidoreductase [Acidimicrobiia bacterium]